MLVNCVVAAAAASCPRLFSGALEIAGRPPYLCCTALAARTPGGACFPDVTHPATSRAAVFCESRYRVITCSSMYMDYGMAELITTAVHVCALMCQASFPSARSSRRCCYKLLL